MSFIHVNLPNEATSQMLSFSILAHGDIERHLLPCFYAYTVEVFPSTHCLEETENS